MKREINKKRLVKGLIKGEEKAYAYLVDEYYKELCDYATNLSRDNFKSEDIVQNVIIQLWRKREKLDKTISIKNYLYRSVYNEFVDVYRKQMSITALEKKYIEGLDSFVETQDESRTFKLLTAVEKEIELLPPKCKETFLLSKKEGLTYNEIADYLNISVNTVEKNMVRAFSILRKKMKQKVNHLLFFLFGYRIS
ncbi:sigma-70 family RNA polymerase sigma factor [Muricauda sp. SCSIO 64092]|uniref:RNA polymerase sigma factor n=1 Tax=Allomuricauda sp. SCSIO 64092 TaxID=2908842 RepID=UPI001FF6BCF9|nr:sigma-70 family RNA polymerase sigma factor [Muricauda sp. SCSIO 64092]UOY05776.1 sigma-70 family RNA polymerase sigma factor [Muricauda sp. SCSIO 64092]